MVYCHTSYLWEGTTGFFPGFYPNSPVFVKGNWYKIFKEDIMEDKSIIVYIFGLGVPLNFYIENKIGNTQLEILSRFPPYQNTVKLFSEFFYTKEEFREIQLNELLNG